MQSGPLLLLASSGKEKTELTDISKVISKTKYHVSRTTKFSLDINKIVISKMIHLNRQEIDC